MLLNPYRLQRHLCLHTGVLLCRRRDLALHLFQLWPTALHLGCDRTHHLGRDRTLLLGCDRALHLGVDRALHLRGYRTPLLLDSDRALFIGDQLLYVGADVVKQLDAGADLVGRRALRDAFLILFGDVFELLDASFC